MPQAKAKSATGISIDLDSDQTFYTAGSQVAGVVSLNTTRDYALGSVNLEFYGRVKVHFVQSHGEGESHWRGRALLFSEKQTLYEGYHTHKPGSFSWPFDLTLPKHPDPQTVAEGKHQWDPREHYLSTGGFLDEHTMPPTFKHRKWGFGFRYTCFVEYVLKVSITEPSEGRSSLLSFSKTATLPIRVAHTAEEQTKGTTLPCAIQFSVPQQICEKARSHEDERATVPDTKMQTIRHTMRSSKLLQKRGHYQSSIFSGIRDKAKSVVDPESLPRFSFDVVVQSSTSTRLLNVNDLEFRIGLREVHHPEATTIPESFYPQVKVINFSLSIEVAVYIRFKSWLRDRTMKTKYDIPLCDKSPVGHILTAMQQSSGLSPEAVVSIPSIEDELVDLIKLSGVSTSLTSAKLGKQTETPLVPTFNTYIIARQYRLNWRLELEVAGETVRISNDEKLDVQVLPPEASALAEMLRTSNVEALEVEGDRDDSEGEEDQTKDVKRKLKGLLRRTKQEEAAEDAEAAESSQPSAQHDEALPAYQSADPNLEFRNEIADRPPGYEEAR